jgi:hypothetical protein
MSTDRVKNGLRGIVRSGTHLTDYHALYSYTVNAQNDDGTLEVTPDVEWAPKLSKVPILLGIPHAEVEVEPGARVLVGFMDGNPSKPYVAHWGASTAIRLYLHGGNIPVAKEGSKTKGHTHTVVIASGSSAGTYTTTSSVDEIDVGQGSPTVRVP